MAARCPNCYGDGPFTNRYGREIGGEPDEILFEGNYLECDNCGACFFEEELLDDEDMND